MFTKHRWTYLMSLLAALRALAATALRRVLHKVHPYVFEPVRVGRMVAPWSRTRAWVRRSASVAVFLCAILSGVHAAMPEPLAHAPTPAVSAQPGPLALVEERGAYSGLDSLVAERSRTLETYSQRYGISESLAASVWDISASEGIDPELAFRLVYTESRFHPQARSPVGALGLTQLMPSTARLLDRSLRSHEDILEVNTNLRLGFRYLREMMRQYDGNTRLALVAYNRGPGAVDKDIKRGRDPFNGYEHLVLGPEASGTARARYHGKGLMEE